jgi:protein gp37
MSATTIHWTQAVWNPCTGCTKVSAGCVNCYAAKMARRLKAMGNLRYKRGFDLTLHNDKIDEPKRWRKGRRVFVNSMSDLFHEKVPLKFIQRVFATMVDCPQHTFQVLTKRGTRLRELAGSLPWPENIWMGVSIEDERVAKRVHDLLATPARMKWVSAEPLLGPLPNLPVDQLDWLVVGGESGPGARPMDLDWARDLRDRCNGAGTPFFFKQIGGTRKWKTGRLLDGVTWDQYPRTDMGAP